MTATLAPADLDEVDWRILDVLQRDGRVSYATLAPIIGLSQPGIRARVQRLLTSGVVRVVGVVDPIALGTGVAGAAFVRVDRAAATVMGHLAALPETTLVMAATGRFDLVAELRCGSDRQLLDILDRVRALPEVRTVETCRYLHIEKEEHRVHRKQPIDIDEIDRTLLRALQLDGRTSYAALTSIAGLSLPAVRARVQRLVQAGVLSFVGIINPHVRGLIVEAAIAVAVDRPSRQVAAELAQHSEVAFLAVTAGRYDLLGWLRCPSNTQLFNTLDTISSVPGVHALESIPALHIEKEQYAANPQLIPPATANPPTLHTPIDAASTSRID